MAPSWLPRNIQKRIFLYIFNRLALFSDLDVQKLEVSLGTKSNLSVKDVHLDPDKIKLPGVYLRSGKIGALDLAVSVTEGVHILGSHCDLTVALSSANIEEDDLSTLLLKTTADLAESLLIDDGTDDTTNNDIGYGFGDFPQMVSKVADYALSQLNVTLEHISLRLIIDEDTIIDILLAKVHLETGTDGRRHVTVSGIEFTCPVRAPTPPEYDSEPESDEVEHSLLQSTLFSREEASTMYMSAMSTIVNQTANASKLHLFWCDKAEFSFKGTRLSELRVNVGKVRVALRPLPSVLQALLNFASDVAVHSHPVPEEERVQEVDDVDRFSLEEVTIADMICSNSLLVNGMLEDDNALKLVMMGVNVRVNALIRISTLVVRRQDYNIFAFKSMDGDGDEDVICELGKTMSMFLPKVGQVRLSLDDAIEIFKIVDMFLPLVPVARDESVRDESVSGPAISAHLNAFEISVDTGKCLIDATMLPMTVESNSLTVDKVYLTVKNDQNEDTIEAGRITVSLDSSKIPPLVSKTTDEVKQVLTRLDIDTVKATVSDTTVATLLHDFKKWEQYVRTKELSNGQGRVRMVDRESVLLAISVAKIECQYKFASSQLGQFDVDIGGIDSNFLQSGPIQISFSSIFVSRDFSDIDSTVGHVPLIYMANPHLKVSEGFFFVL
jgi:hypothetical protein